jgi:hypothetical protein
MVQAQDLNFNTMLNYKLLKRKRKEKKKKKKKERGSTLFCSAGIDCC